MAEEDVDPWVQTRKHMRHFLPVAEARHQLCGSSPTMYDARVKAGEVSFVKICPAHSHRRKTSMISSDNATWTPHRRGQRP